MEAQTPCAVEARPIEVVREYAAKVLEEATSTLELAVGRVNAYVGTPDPTVGRQADQISAPPKSEEGIWYINARLVDIGARLSEIRLELGRL